LWGRRPTRVERRRASRPSFSKMTEKKYHLLSSINRNGPKGDTRGAKEDETFVGEKKNKKEKPAMRHSPQKTNTGINDDLQKRCKGSPIV